MSGTTAGWVLLALATAALTLGHPQAGLFLALASAGVGVVSTPSTTHRDAWRRNHAHPMRGRR